VDVDRFSESVHGFLECAECHQGADDMEIHPDEAPVTDCAVCHEDADEEFEASIHGQARADGRWENGCTTCHGEIHSLMPQDNPESPVHPMRLPQTCGVCHARSDLTEDLAIRLVQPLAAYTDSVHARAVQEGVEGATCTKCHGSHHLRVSNTCGQCHVKITETYDKSIHGQAAAHGVRESPVCTDCHGEHRILSHLERGSPVFASNLPQMTCGRCHGDLRLAEKFGMAADKVSAYEDSYHGLASRSGVATVANCASCHGVHDILPSTDPRSSIHKDNLASTCGHCHPGAGTAFAIGPVHVIYSEPEHAAVYFVRLGYIWLIVLTIGGMVLHNLLDFIRKARRPLPQPLLPVSGARERMSLWFRIAHALLLVTFVALVYTGFALKFPEAWWAWPLLQWESEFGVRGWIHRVAAVGMLLAGAIHLVHLAVDRRARACIAQMRPGREDLYEIRERFAFFFGHRPFVAEAPWIGYPEKMEYLAVIWGTLVMAVTGFVLWFQDPVLRWLPTWVTDVATVVHFYEAILASLAILVWHMYAVIFDPVVYPMDTAWLTGRSAPGRQLERQGPAQRARAETLEGEPASDEA
jgi:cytochrome b subunit of formate dehydrogenase